MKQFFIRVFNAECDQKPIKEYKSRVVPENGDQIEFDNNKFLHIHLRIFDANDPDNIRVYGLIDEAI